MEEAGVKLVAENINVYVGNLKNAESATNGFVDATEKGSGRINGASEIIIGGLRKIGSVAVEAFLQAGKAVVDFVGDSIGKAGDFEASMLEFQSVAGKEVDTSGLEDFRDLFIDIGKRLPVSTSEVQQAAIEMVKGGIDPATIAAGGLEQNIQFAAAAMQGDLVKAAEISSKIMGGWTSITDSAADKSTFLTHATDLLAKAANASSTDVEGLSQGIFNAQGIAKTAGVSFDDLTTTLAALAPRFASSSEAGNSLKNMIARLQPTTDPATQAMMSLGLYTEETGSAFYDAQGNFVGFQQASQLLQDSLAGLTKEQQAATLQQIFGNDAMGSAAALAELGAAGYQGMADALANANGVADAAALKQQGFNVALDNAKGSVEALQITIGSALLPILGDLLDNYISPAINTLTDLASAVFGDEEAFNKLSPTMQGIATTIQTVADNIESLVSPAQDLAGMLGDNLEPILFGIGTALAVAVVPPLLTATGAFLAAAAPVVALVAAGALLYKAWESDFGGIRTVVTQFWEETLQPALQDLWDWFAQTLPPVIESLSQMWTDTFLPAIESVADFWTGTLQPALSDVWGVIKNDVLPIVVALVDVGLAVLQKASEALAGFWEKTLQPALKTVGDYLKVTLGPAFTSIGDWLKGTFGPVLEDVTAWLGDVTGGFGGIKAAASGVVEWLGKLADKIRNLELPDWLTPGSPTPWEIGLRGIGDALSTSVAPGIDLFTKGLGQISTGVPVAMEQLTTGLVTGATGALNQMRDTFLGSDIIDAMGQLGQDIMGGIGKGIKDGARSVKNIIQSTASTVKGAFENAFGAHSPATEMIPVGESITQGMMQGMANMWPAMTSLVSELGADLVAQAVALGESVQGAIADSFGATASIDRQISKNLSSLAKDVLPQYQDTTKGALKDAEHQARQFLDPKEGAAFFKARSDQILEYAKLQKDLADTLKTAGDAQAQQRARAAQADAEYLQLQKDLAVALKAAGEAAEIKHIQDQKQAIEEQQRVNQLNATIADKDTDALSRQKAILDLQELRKRQAQRTPTVSSEDARVEAIRRQMDQVKATAADEQRSGTQAQRDAEAQAALLRQQMVLINAAQTAEISAAQANLGASRSGTESLMEQIGEFMRTKTKNEKGEEVDAFPGILENDTIKAFDGWLRQMTNYAPNPYRGGMMAPPTNNNQRTYNMPIYTNQSPTVVQDSMALAGAMYP